MQAIFRLANLRQLMPLNRKLIFISIWKITVLLIYSAFKILGALFL